MTEPPTLRSLARRYAEGELDRDEFRRLRTELIEGVVAGELPAPAPPARVPPARPPAPAAGEAPTQPTSGARRPRTGRMLLAAAVAAIALGTLLAGRFGGDDAPPEQQRRSLVPPPELAAPNPLAEFLSRDDWSTTELDALAAQWVALEPERREMLAGSPMLLRFVDRLHAELLETRALADVDPALTDDARVERLLALVATLGINDPRIAAVAGDLGALGAARAESEPAAAPQREEAAAAEETDESGEPKQAAGPPVADAAGEREAQPPAEGPGATVIQERRPPAGEPAPVPETASDGPATPAPVSALAADGAAAPATTSAVSERAARTDGRQARARERAVREAGCRAELARSRRPYCRDALASGGAGPVMVVLPPGGFRMGGKEPAEQPRHEVRIDYPFAIAAFETAAAELERFCGATNRRCPEQPWGAEFPAVNLDWHEASAYAAWLAAETGQTYRLPTEAEWEYAARGGSDGTWPFGEELLPTDARFSYGGLAVDGPLPARDRSVNRNGFRLYHMVGNVREWVADVWHPNHEGAPADGSARPGPLEAERVVRGGSFRDGPAALRSAARERLAADARDAYTGFRVVVDLRPEADAYAGRAWLAGQHRDKLTLQLFAVQQMDKVRALRAAHPALALHVLPVTGAEVRYRVVYGLFDSAEQAQAAFAALPAAIVEASGRPIIKSVAELRAATESGG